MCRGLSQMKVVHITNYWRKSNGGGLKTYVTNLVDALTRRGLDVNVCFREGDDPTQFHLIGDKITFSLSCLQILQRQRPDVVHSHGEWYCLLPGCLYKWRYGCKLIFTYHTEPIKKLPRLGNFFFYHLLKRCDYVTFVSKNLRERIAEVDGFKFPNTAITYAGVSAGTVSDEEINAFRRRYNIDLDAIVLLAQGMTAHRLKVDGLKVLIQAISLLKMTCPEVVLIATRDGSFLSELKAFAKEMGVEERLIFTGEVENPYVPLQLCNIYTHITRGEGGLSLALLEAMSMGKPIVASATGGIPEAIEDGSEGLLVELDSHLIAEKIIYILHNPGVCRTISSNAQSRVKERFTWNHAVENCISLYTGNQ